jgi:hypothetical protein
MSQDWAATTVIGNRGGGRGSTKSASAINSARRRGEVFVMSYLLIELLSINDFFGEEKLYTVQSIFGVSPFYILT